MIIPAQGLRIVLAVRPVDFRCGHDALAGLVQNTLGLDPLGLDRGFSFEAGRPA